MSSAPVFISEVLDITNIARDDDGVYELEFVARPSVEEPWLTRTRTTLARVALPPDFPVGQRYIMKLEPVVPSVDEVGPV